MASAINRYQSRELQTDDYLAEEEAIFERLDIAYQLSAAVTPERGEGAANFDQLIERRDMDDTLRE